MYFMPKIFILALTTDQKLEKHSKTKYHLDLTISRALGFSHPTKEFALYLDVYLNMRYV